MSVGNCRPAALIAACTSCAAASMSRLSSNCRLIEVAPSVLVEVICVTPAIWENWRSSGCATAEAMVSGLAPGKDADTLMVGKSTLGSGATGKRGKATRPVSATAIIRSEVATGRRMKGAEIFMARSSRPPALRRG